MALKEYKKKRKFEKTPEPEGKIKDRKGEHRFVVQKHHASHLHYDFRLEIEGVLKSWAIPKGPSMNPSDKRLAMMVEDHPVEYGKFEGIIPKGNYGAGTVMVWDEGTYHAPGIEGEKENEKTLRKAWLDGNIKIVLEGKKLKGEFALVRMNRGKGNEWLLIKKKDKYASDKDVLKEDKSVVTSRTLEEIKDQSGKENAVWYSNKNDKEIKLGKEAKKTKMPHDVKPMMATLVKEVFDSDDWIFEIKWDGYRAIAEINYNVVSLYSRNNLSFNDRFPTISESLSKLGMQVVFDGEIVSVDEKGKSSFQLIQNYQRTGKGKIIYYVFDILYYNGYDLTELPLLERKSIIKKLLPDLPDIKYSDHIIGNGISFFEAANKNELEGIMAKKANSKYSPGLRGRDWLKIKIQKQQEAVIAGFTEPRGSRKHLGALVLGVYDGDELTYIGHSGGGFNDKDLQAVFLKLKPLVQKESSFKNTPKTNMPVKWVKPQIVCEVKFQEWTDEGIMRIPIFMGIREDKNAKEVKREIEKPINKIVKNETTKRSNKIKAQSKNTDGEDEAEKAQNSKQRSDVKTRAGVKNRKPAKRSEEKLIKNKKPDNAENGRILEIDSITLEVSNLKKIFWPEEGYTKGDLIEYYDKISPYILPYLKDRPENLRRNPNGYNQQSFFHKDMPSTTPDWIETIKLYSESNDKYVNYMLCQNKAALIYMANLGCIEINPWLSRKQSIEYPDHLVIDLDPLDVSFEDVIEVALAVKEVLDKGKIKGFCKTSGSRGMHIYVPMGAKYDYDQSKQLAQLIASYTHQLVPSLTSLERMPNKRKNKVYIDYLQNRSGQTLAAPYCLRPKPGATVSTPIEWEEVKSGLHPSQFNIKTIFERLESKGDIFKGIMGKGVDIEKVLEKLKS